MYATGRLSDVHFLPGKLFFIGRQGQAYFSSEDKGICGLERRSGFLCPPNNLLSYICSLLFVGWWCIDNQFLVWVAKKVFAQSDLDLVLTEYYKERLKSQLKNRKTHTNEQNSTESIVLLLPTHLFIFFDWISTLKLSSLRPPFPLLTPPPSPLSLPF